MWACVKIPATASWNRSMRLHVRCAATSLPMITPASCAGLATVVPCGYRSTRMG